jgi:hypothetical protein
MAKYYRLTNWLNNNSIYCVLNTPTYNSLNIVNKLLPNIGMLHNQDISRLYNLFINY